MNLISRYVFRETFRAWLVVMLVLFSILMSNQFAQILGEAAADELPRDAVFAIMGLTSLRYLTMLTPIALFLAVMLALARLSRDSEMAALGACGIGPAQLLAPLAVFAAILAALVAWLALEQTPEASRRIEQIRFQARESLELGVLESGRFTSPDSGDTVVYAREVAGNEIRDVFLQRQADQQRVAVILAERGQRVADPRSGVLSFVLYNGRRYEGVPGEKRFLTIQFAEHGIPIRGEEQETFVEPVQTRPTELLVRSGNPEDEAELQWRFSAPVSLLVLVLLAVPLSRSSPREGRYARLGLGLLIYIVYANMLSIARVWVEDGRVPDWMGMWWVHGLAGLVGLYLLAREAGWFVPVRRIDTPRSA